MYYKFSFVVFSKISVHLLYFVMCCYSMHCCFHFFLYDDLFVPLRRSCFFSTTNVQFLYDFSSLLSNILHSFFFFLIPASCVVQISPASCKLFLFPLSFFSLSLSRARSCARVYIIMYLCFPFLFFSFVFMFYNRFANQRIMKKFPVYSKIIRDIFCLYCNKFYFCIRLARESKSLSLTY